MKVAQQIVHKGYLLQLKFSFIQLMLFYFPWTLIFNKIKQDL